MQREPFSYKACVHYNGTGLICKKGVEPRHVQDEDHRTPCVEIRGVTGKVACDLRVLPEGPARGAIGPASKMLAAVLEGMCPTCGGDVAGQLEFNGAVLALPCRHVIRSKRDDEA